MFRPPEPPAGGPAAPGDNPLELGRHLVLSTTHVSLATSELLESWAGSPIDCQPLTVATTWHGWFVATYEVEGEAAALIPPELAAIQRFARALDCSFILFDCDGDTVAGLPTFSW